MTPGFAAVGDQVLHALEELGIEYPHTYRLEQSPQGVLVGEITGLHLDVIGLRARYQDPTSGLLREAVYDPLLVSRAQRNRAVLSAELVAAGPYWTRVRRLWAPFIRQAHDQLRVLICDGPAMLAWVGGFSREDFTWRERDKLQRLVPVLRQRLLRERRVLEAGVLSSALEAVLEALPGAAWLLDETLRPVHHNRAARGLPVDASALRLTPVEAPGLPRHFLAQSPQPTAGFLSLRAFATRYGLSAQETRVLGLVVQGHTNRAIATELQCSERTVEVHLTRLLAKTDGASRGEVVARYWREART